MKEDESLFGKSYTLLTKTLKSQYHTIHQRPSTRNFHLGIEMYNKKRNKFNKPKSMSTFVSGSSTMSVREGNCDMSSKKFLDILDFVRKRKNSNFAALVEKYPTTEEIRRDNFALTVYKKTILSKSPSVEKKNNYFLVKSKRLGQNSSVKSVGERNMSERDSSGDKPHSEENKPYMHFLSKLKMKKTLNLKKTKCEIKTLPEKVHENLSMPILEDNNPSSMTHNSITQIKEFFLQTTTPSLPSGNEDVGLGMVGINCKEGVLIGGTFLARPSHENKPINFKGRQTRELGIKGMLGRATKIKGDFGPWEHERHFSCH